MTTTAKNGNPGDPKSGDQVESIESGPAPVRKFGLNVHTEPLREMRLEMGLDMQVVYFAIRVPVAGGVTLRIPVLTTITPRLYSPTRAQHL